MLNSDCKGTGMFEGDKQPSDVFVSLVSVAGPYSSENLPSLIKQAVAMLETNYTNFEFILIDNGVSAELFEKISALLSHLPCVRILRLVQNRDFEVAAFSGIEAAIGDYVAFFEIEVDPLEEVERAIGLGISGIDIVQGLATDNQGKTLRNFSRSLFFRFSRVFAGLNVPASATYLVSFSRTVLNAIVASPPGLKYLRHLLGNIGFRIEYMRYKQIHEALKRKRLGLTAAVEVLTSYSLRPLRVVSAVGLVAAAINLLYTFFVVFTFLTSEVERGWASTNFQLGTMFFLLFSSLSLISEYIGRVLTESQRQSAYIVKEEFVSSRSIANEYRRNIG